MTTPASALLWTTLLIASRCALAAEIAIDNLADLDFGVVPPTVGTLRSRTAFCVSLAPGGRYQVQATGDGPGGAFTLQGSAGAHTLSYRVFVATRGRGRGQEVQPGAPLTGIQGKEPRAGVCRPPLGSIHVQIDDAELQQAQADRYRGTLSMTVAPE